MNLIEKITTFAHLYDDLTNSLFAGMGISLKQITFHNRKRADAVYTYQPVLGVVNQGPVANRRAADNKACQCDYHTTAIVELPTGELRDLEFHFNSSESEDAMAIRLAVHIADHVEHLAPYAKKTPGNYSNHDGRYN